VFPGRSCNFSHFFASGPRRTLPGLGPSWMPWSPPQAPQVDLGWVNNKWGWVMMCLCYYVIYLYMYIYIYDITLYDVSIYLRIPKWIEIVDASQLKSFCMRIYRQATTHDEYAQRSFNMFQHPSTWSWCILGCTFLVALFNAVQANYKC